MQVMTVQPSKLSIADLFQTREQYLIPLFQRGYVWTLHQQIQPLWEDIADRVDALAEHQANAQKVGGAEKLKSLRKHFLGAIVVGAPLSHDPEVIPSREVIDGQQRTTTLQIMLFALRDVLAPLDDEALDDDLRTLTHNKGKYKSKSDHLKVWPTNVGRDVLRFLYDAGNCSSVTERYPARGPDKERWDRPLMVQTYLFFYGIIGCFLRGKRFDDPADEADVTDGARTVTHALLKSISNDNILRLPFEELPIEPSRATLLLDAFQKCFQIMRLQLDDEDDPQIIFETLNARGEPLTPSDLIRNFLFLRASRNGEPVDELYDRHWRAFDEQTDPAFPVKSAVKFWRKEERQGRLKSTRLDLLFYHYMGLRKRDEVKVAHVFEEFKEWWEDGEPRDMTVELARITKLSARFKTFLAPTHKTRFGLFCRRLRLLDTATPIPLIFHLLEHAEPDSADFIQALGDIESYLVRRFICGMTTKSYNRLFVQRLLAEMAQEGKADAATLRTKLLALEGPSQRWPHDDEFEAAWIHRQLYEGSNTRRVQAVLEGLEFGMRTSRQEFLPDLAVLSVEHVMPQGWTEADYPLSTPTPEARADRRRLVHGIGNLTLVTPGFNSSLSNAGFAKKRPELASNSSLLLNAYFQQISNEASWNEDTIVARARSTYLVAKAIWPRPATVPQPQFGVAALAASNALA
jgi:hypothetical protein